MASSPRPRRNGHWQSTASGRFNEPLLERNYVSPKRRNLNCRLVSDSFKKSEPWQCREHSALKHRGILASLENPVANIGMHLRLYFRMHLW